MEVGGHMVPGGHYSYQLVRVGGNNLVEVDDGQGQNLQAPNMSVRAWYLVSTLARLLLLLASSTGVGGRDSVANARRLLLSVGGGQWSAGATGRRGETRDALLVAGVVARRGHSRGGVLVVGGNALATESTAFVARATGATGQTVGTVALRLVLTRPDGTGVRSARAWTNIGTVAAAAAAVRPASTAGAVVAAAALLSVAGAVVRFGAIVAIVATTVVAASAIVLAACVRVWT